MKTIRKCGTVTQKCMFDKNNVSYWTVCSKSPNGELTNKVENANGVRHPSNWWPQK